MRKAVIFSAIFLGAITLEVAARAYYDAVVVESRGAGDGSSVRSVTKAFDPKTDCLLPKDQGPCRASVPAVYYSAETRRCKNFIYGGCGGNNNRFRSKAECESRCKGVVVKRSSKPEDCIPLGESCEARGCRAAPKSANDAIECKPCICPPVTEAAQAVCRQPPAARGHCRALLPRWSYEQGTKSCREFQFGGCDGNGNNFASKEACLRLCSGI